MEPMGPLAVLECWFEMAVRAEQLLGEVMLSVWLTCHPF